MIEKKETIIDCRGCPFIDIDDDGYCICVPKEEGLGYVPLTVGYVPDFCPLRKV